MTSPAMQMQNSTLATHLMMARHERNGSSFTRRKMTKLIQRIRKICGQCLPGHGSHDMIDQKRWVEQENKTMVNRSDNENLVEDLFDNFPNGINKVSYMMETNIPDSDVGENTDVTHEVIKVFNSNSGGDCLNAVVDVLCGVEGIGQDVSLDIVENEISHFRREETVEALDNCSEIVRVEHEDWTVTSRFPTASVGPVDEAHDVAIEVAVGGGLPCSDQCESVTRLVTVMEDMVASCTIVQARSTSNSIPSSEVVTDCTISNPEEDVMLSVQEDEILSKEEEDVGDGVIAELPEDINNTPKATDSHSAEHEMHQFVVWQAELGDEVYEETSSHSPNVTAMMLDCGERQVDNDEFLSLMVTSGVNQPLCFQDDGNGDNPEGLYELELCGCGDTDMDILKGGEVADSPMDGADCTTPVVEGSQLVMGFPEDEEEFKTFFLSSELSHTEKLFSKSFGRKSSWCWWLISLLLILSNNTGVPWSSQSPDMGSLRESVSDLQIRSDHAKLKDKSRSLSGGFSVGLEDVEDYIWDMEIWNKTRSRADVTAWGWVRPMYNKTDLMNPAIEVEEGKGLLRSSFKDEMRLAIGVVIAERVNGFDPKQANHIGIGREMIYKAADMEKTVHVLQVVVEVKTMPIIMVHEVKDIAMEVIAGMVEDVQEHASSSYTKTPAGKRNRTSCLPEFGCLNLPTNPKSHRSIAVENGAFFLVLPLAVLGCSLFQIWCREDDPQERLVAKSQVYRREGIIFIKKEEQLNTSYYMSVEHEMVAEVTNPTDQVMRCRKEDRLSDTMASSLNNKEYAGVVEYSTDHAYNPEIPARDRTLLEKKNESVADLDRLPRYASKCGEDALAALGCSWIQEDDPKGLPGGTSLYTMEEVKNIKNNPVIMSDLKSNLLDIQRQLSSTVLTGDQHEGLDGNTDLSWEDFPYRDLTWTEVEHDLAQAECVAARERVMQACKEASTELKHIDIEEERMEMIKGLDQLVDQYVCAYSEYDGCHIRLVGEHLPGQEEDMLWQCIDVVEEVKEIIREPSNTSRVLTGFIMSNKSRAMDEDKTPYHKWPDITVNIRLKTANQFPKMPPIMAKPPPVRSLCTTPSSSPCSSRTPPSCSMTPPLSPRKPDMLGSRTRPGPWMTSLPGMGRVGIRPSSPPWISSRC